MESESVSERVPLLNTANLETIAWVLSISEERIYAPNTVLIPSDGWGKSVSFILSGWVIISTKVQQQEKALEILGQGDYLGVMAVLDDYPPLSQAITLSETRLLTIPAQRFLQLLLKDNQLQQRMLQLTIQRVRHLYRRLKFLSQSSARKIIKTLVYLAENYGKTTENGITIWRLSEQILANLVNTEPEIVSDVLEQLRENHLLESREADNQFCIPNLKQLHHYSKQF
jgi:CRP/FNR family cyclic AMP-dependent transcriptional regulator